MSNPNYTGLVAFVAEQSIKKKAKLIWSKSSLLFAMMWEKKGGKFDDRYRIEGLKAIAPLNFAEQTTAADGVLDANEFTAITPYGTSGFTQVEYAFSHYRAAMYIKDSEEKLIAGQGVRTNLLESKTNQLTESFRKAIATDQMSANNCDRDAVLGMRYLLSTTNSPGNISQNTYPVWAAGVKTGAGPWQLGLIDDQYDRITALGRSKPDIALLSYSANNNVYGKMRDSIAPSQLITKPGSMAQYGFVTFEYLDMMCGQEARLGDALPGSAMLLSSDSFFAGALSDAPVKKHVTPLEGTDSMEYMFNWWLFYGCDDAACNSLIQDIE